MAIPYKIIKCQRIDVQIIEHGADGDLRMKFLQLEIIEDNPKLAFRIREIETLRQAILEEKYSAENRALEVTYLYE